MLCYARDVFFFLSSLSIRHLLYGIWVVRYCRQKFPIWLLRIATFDKICYNEIAVKCFSTSFIFYKTVDLACIETKRYHLWFGRNHSEHENSSNRHIPLLKSYCSKTAFFPHVLIFFSMKYKGIVAFEEDIFFKHP